MNEIFIAPTSWSSSEAIAAAIDNGCAAVLSGIPPVYQATADEQGWTLPCIITEGAGGAITDWRPV